VADLEVADALVEGEVPLATWCWPISVGITDQLSLMSILSAARAPVV
jgi:hypothetical protein